jgi:hypothetical protein
MTTVFPERVPSRKNVFYDSRAILEDLVNVYASLYAETSTSKSMWHPDRLFAKVRDGKIKMLAVLCSGSRFAYVDSGLGPEFTTAETATAMINSTQGDLDEASYIAEKECWMYQ